MEGTELQYSVDNVPIKIETTEEVIDNLEKIFVTVNKDERDAADTTNESTRKCGEIFLKDDFNFILICSICQRTYQSLHEFGEHILEAHITRPRTPEFLDVKSEIYEIPNSDSDSPSKATCNFVETLTKDAENGLETSSSSEENERQNRLSVTKKSNRAKNTKNCIVPRKPSKPGPKVKDPNRFCDICNVYYGLRTTFRRHALQHDPIPTALKNDPIFLKCYFCHIEFETIAEWRDHEPLHKGGPLPYKCSHCAKQFRNSTSLRMHVNSHTGERPYKCDQCDLAFAHSGNLSWHIRRIHLREASHACDVCDKRFVSRTELSFHKASHTNERPYQCAECGQRFKLSSALNLHMDTHKMVKDIKCPHCPALFRTKKVLGSHLVAHSTLRPHVCAVCLAAFSRKKALIVHEKIHSDVKGYVCNICGKAFAQPAGLHCHRKSHMLAEPGKPKKRRRISPKVDDYLD